MKQNTRKNKTNQSVIWPTTPYFTITDLARLNPKMLTVSGSDITLRVRLTKAIESGSIAELGAIPGGKGRPKKIFAMTPVTQNVLNKAKQDSINLVDNADKLVHVINVAPRTSNTITPSVNTPNLSVVK